MTLKSDGVALATVATKATANIIIIAQARAIGNRQLATKSRVVAEVSLSSPTSIHSAAARVNVRSGDILQHCGGLRWPGGHSLRTPGAVPAGSGGRIDE